MNILAMLFVILGFLFSTSTVYAGFNFTIPQTNVTSDQDIEASVVLSLQGQNNKTYYLEGAFKKEGTTNYFGLTWNDSSWVKYTASNFSSLKSVTTDQTGNWSGSVKVKIDKDSSLFSGNGTYTLKMKRFTTAGSETWSDNDITLIVSSPPSPSPTPTPSSSSLSDSSFSSNSQTSLFIISGIPSNINSDQPFNVSTNLSLPNNPTTDFYLKGAFRHPDKPSNYFGFTKVNSDWVKNSSTYTNQYKITTNSSGNWSGNIEVKPDADDSGFIGTGDYIFKVGRYKDVENSSVIWSNEVTIKIISVETSDQGGSSSETTSKKSASQTNPTSLPQVSKINPANSLISKSSNKLDYRIASVAGAAASSSATPSASIESKNERKNFIPWIGVALIICGFISLGYIYLRSRKIL